MATGLVAGLPSSRENSSKKWGISGVLFLQSMFINSAHSDVSSGTIYWSIIRTAPLSLESVPIRRLRSCKICARRRGNRISSSMSRSKNTLLMSVLSTSGSAFTWSRHRFSSGRHTHRLEAVQSPSVNFLQSTRTTEGILLSGSWSVSMNPFMRSASRICRSSRFLPTERLYPSSSEYGIIIS